MIERTVQLTGADRSGDGERFDYSGTGLFFHRVDGGPLWLRLDESRMLIPVYAGRSVQVPFSHFWLVHASGLTGTVQVLVLRDGELVADAPARGQFGTGLVRGVVGTDPPAGNEWSEVVPTGFMWRLMSLHTKFDTDATVVDRLPRFHLNMGLVGALVLVLPAVAVVPASQSVELVWAPGCYYPPALPTRQVMSLPVGFVLPGDSWLHSVTDNLQAGDDYSRSPRILVEEWVE